MPSFDDIIKVVENAVEKFNGRIPAIQKKMYQALLDEVKKLDTGRKGLKATVGNMRRVVSIKAKLQRIILSPEYKGAIKEFVKVFNEVTTIQNTIFKQAEADFSPPKLGAELKKQSVLDVVNNLTERGIAGDVTNAVADILRTNISTGSSYAALTEALRESLTQTKSPGILQRYARQITTDAVNQYTASYMRNISSDLKYEWFRYAGKDIATTRPFCDAMTDRQYFHISEVPDLLKAKDLYYTVEGGGSQKVPINNKTGLPAGMIPGTDAGSFFSNRGGYNCGHQIFPVSEKRVPIAIRERVFSTAAYRRWKAAA